MDRIVPGRRLTALLFVLTLIVILCPTAGGRAMPPNLSDEPAGDPGDGVLRPADASWNATPAAAGGSSASATAAVPAGPSATYLLVPCWAPAGQPWPLTFRLVRFEDAGAAGIGAAGVGACRPTPFSRRWHRAP